jgi:hypothetical protein
MRLRIWSDIRNAHSVTCGVDILSHLIDRRGCHFTETGLHERHRYSEARLWRIRQGRCLSWSHVSPRWLTWYIITVSVCVCVWVVLQGNFKDLFKSIEQYENDLGINM